MKRKRMIKLLMSVGFDICMMCLPIITDRICNP